MSDLFARILKLLRLISAKFRGALWHLIRILGVFRSSAMKLREPCFDYHVLSQQQQEDAISPKPCTSYLTTSEADQIREQFKKADNGRKLLFWTNVPKALAQTWANANGANTLTDMMGPLMDKVHSHKQGKQWTKYVKGVSCLFAELAREKPSVLVLTTPPGVARYRKESTFKSLEEPILKESFSLEIHYVHPTVQGAEAVVYSRWPVDNTLLWSKGFGNEKQTDPADLWKKIRKGVGSPHFSAERFSPLQTELESRKRIQPCCLLSKTTTDCLTVLFRFTQQAIMFLKRRVIFSAQNFIELLKQKLCRFVGQANHMVRKIMSIQISFPYPGHQVVEVQQKNAGTQTQQNASTEVDTSDKPIDVPQDHKPEKPVTAPVNKLTKKEKKMAKKSEVKQPQSKSETSASKNPSSSQPTLQAIMQTQLNTFRCDGQKEHLRQLGVFASLLDKYGSQTGTHIEYKLQRTESPSSMIVATLLCAGSKFQAQASSKKMAKRLAAQKACQQLNIT